MLYPFLTVLVFFITSSLFGNEIKDFDPVIIDFDMNHISDVSKDNCWNDKNEFLLKKCKLETESCLLELEGKVRNTVNVTFRDAEPLGLDVFNYSRPNEGSVTSSTNADQIARNIPIGSRLIVFKRNENNFTIYFDKIIQKEETFLLKDIRQPYHKLSFLLDIPKHVNVTAKVLGVSLYNQRDSSGEQYIHNHYEVMLPEGSFNFFFTYQDKNEKYSFEKRVTIESKNSSNTIVKIPASDFKLDNQKKSNKYGLYSHKNTFLSALDDSGFFQGFLKLPQITIPEKSIRVDHFFEFTKGTIVLKPEAIQHFDKTIEGLPRYSFLFDGQCARYSNNEEFNHLEVYSKVSGGILLGKLVFSIVNNHRGLIYYPLGKLEGVAFNPSIANGSGCGKQFYHEGNSISKDWVDLGSGPWGSVGWIKYPAKKFFSWETRFDWKDGTTASFFKKDDKIIGKGTRYIEANGDAESEDFEFEVKKTDLVDNNGRLNLELSSSDGCH